jgi:hypothetical protein
MPPTFRTVVTELAKRLFAIDSISTLDVVEALGNRLVDILGSVFLIKVSRHDEVIDCPVEELVGVSRSAGFDFVHDEFFKFRL